MNTALKLVHSAAGKRDYINRLILSEPKTGVLFTDFIEQTLAKKAKRRGESYAKGYNTLIKHVKAFSVEYEAEIYTNSVGEDFLDDFICYLEEKDLRKNYIVTLLSLVKAMTAKQRNMAMPLIRLMMM